MEVGMGEPKLFKPKGFDLGRSHGVHPQLDRPVV